MWTHSKKRYCRINPTNEDLTNWKFKGEFIFGKNKNITVYDSSSISGDVEVGENTWIGPFTAVDGTKPVKIGSYCSISSGVNIVSHDSVKWALSGGRLPYDSMPITIGNNCFIGTKAFIGKGVCLGDHCLVAAHAVVTTSFIERSIIAGIPAKKIGEVIVKSDSIELKYY